MTQAPDDLREQLRRHYEMTKNDLAVTEEAEQLRHALGNLSADTKTMFYEHIQFLADNDAICHEEVDGWLRQYRETYWDINQKDVRMDVVRALAKWWVDSGRSITMTLEHQNRNGKGDSDAIRFIRAEYELITGRKIMSSTVKTYLLNLTY